MIKLNASGITANTVNGKMQDAYLLQKLGKLKVFQLKFMPIISIYDSNELSAKTRGKRKEIGWKPPKIPVNFDISQNLSCHTNTPQAESSHTHTVAVSVASYSSYN